MSSDIELRKLSNVIGQMAVAMNNNTRAINAQTAVLKKLANQQAELIGLENARRLFSGEEGRKETYRSGEASEDAGGGEADRSRSAGEGSSEPGEEDPAQDDDHFMNETMGRGM